MVLLWIMNSTYLNTQVILTAALLALAIAGVVASIVIITLNIHQLQCASLLSRNQVNHGIDQSLDSNNSAERIQWTLELLTNKMIRLAITMLVLSAVGLGIGIWQLAYFYNDQVVRPFMMAGSSIPDLMQWLLIATISILATGWMVVARSRYIEHARRKLITENNIMDNETRQEIIALIEANPGIHFSRMKSTLGHSPRTIRDQLDILMSFGKIYAISIDDKNSYFAFKPSEQQSWLSFLAFVRRGGRVTLLRALLHNQGANFPAIVSATGEPRSTVRRKLNAFEERKYVSIDRNDEEMVCINLVPAIEEFARKVFDRS